MFKRADQKIFTILRSNFLFISILFFSQPMINAMEIYLDVSITHTICLSNETKQHYLLEMSIFSTKFVMGWYHFSPQKNE